MEACGRIEREVRTINGVEHVGWIFLRTSCGKPSKRVRPRLRVASGTFQSVGRCARHSGPTALSVGRTSGEKVLLAGGNWPNGVCRRSMSYSHRCRKPFRHCHTRLLALPLVGAGRILILNSLLYAPTRAGFLTKPAAKSFGFAQDTQGCRAQSPPLCTSRLRCIVGPKGSLCERFSNRDSLTGLWCGRKMRALYGQSPKFIRQNLQRLAGSPGRRRKACSAHFRAYWF